MTAVLADEALRPALERRAQWLEYATTVWNSTEAAVTITTGLAAHSLGLVAFGLDSCVEVFASLVVLWYLRGVRDDVRRSGRAMRLIAIAFLLLTLYLGTEAIRGLIAGVQPSQTWLGLGFLAATVVAMFLLARAKRTTGRRLGNQPLLANASMTMLDGCLAAGILIAVFLAVQLGWWWADALAASIVAAIALHEAHDSWREATVT
jgi:divalent metal cation (Fe/Co/Zn/Cd) transporter